MAKDRGPAPLVLKPLPVFKHAKRPDQLVEATRLGNAALANNHPRSAELLALRVLDCALSRTVFNSTAIVCSVAHFGVRLCRPVPLRDLRIRRRIRSLPRRQMPARERANWESYDLMAGTSKISPHPTLDGGLIAVTHRAATLAWFSFANALNARSHPTGIFMPPLVAEE
jgi:hypothetical protein